jgi:hypothetical protein
VAAARSASTWPIYTTPPSPTISAGRGHRGISGPVAWLVNPDRVPTVAVHSPLLTSQGTWSHDPFRHLILEVRSVERDAIFADLFRKLDQA